MTSLRARSFAAIVTLTRASVANYINSAGTMTSAAVDAPRIDYHPQTLALRGLLLEGSRTNLLLNSGTLATQNVTVTAQTYVLTFFGTGSVSWSGAATGSIGGSATNIRARAIISASAGTLSLTVTGTVTNAQLEAGPVETSYITTAGATATRSADAAVITSAADWSDDGVGTMFVEFQLPYAPLSDANRRLVQFDDGTETNRISLYLNGSGVNMEMTASSTQYVNALLGSFAANTTRKVAYAWSPSTAVGIIDGGSLVNDASATAPTAVTVARLGCATTAGTELSGYIRKVRYWPRRFSDNDLRALVA
jgi:hypothetical protein